MAIKENCKNTQNRDVLNVGLSESAMMTTSKLVLYIFLEIIFQRYIFCKSLKLIYYIIFCLYREKRAVMLNEISLKKKALRDENFPKQELMEEFLIRKDVVPAKLDIEWKLPQISQFIVSITYQVCISSTYINIYQVY